MSTSFAIAVVAEAETHAGSITDLLESNGKILM